METIKANGFDELTFGEMNAVDGGLALTTTLFTVWGIKVKKLFQLNNNTINRWLNSWVRGFIIMIFYS